MSAVGLGGAEISRLQQSYLLRHRASGWSDRGLVDVQSPLLGTNGTATSFAPQKVLHKAGGDKALAHFWLVGMRMPAVVQQEVAFGLCALWAQ